MTLIPNTKSQDWVKTTNKKCKLKKVCILTTILLLLLTIAIVLAVTLSWIFKFNELHTKGFTEQQIWIEMCKNWWSPFMITNDLVDGQPIKIGLKGISYFAIVLIVIDLFASIASIILIFAFKFPKPIDESVKTLGSSPLSDKSAKIY